MQTYEVLVRNRSVVSNSKDMTLVRTSVGIDQLHVLFDSDEWLGFPVTVTFGHGDELVSRALVVSELAGSAWVAESTVEIPWEVIDQTGPIRVTFQGTDSEGRHIITAAGSPLSVEEAGDVVVSDEPDGSPTVSEWQQAYADAMEAVNSAATLVANLEERLASIVSAAEGSIGDMVNSVSVPATTDSLGVMQVGDGLVVTEEGVVSVSSDVTAHGLTGGQRLTISNLSALADMAFDATFDSSGNVQSVAGVKASMLPTAWDGVPGAVLPDDDTIVVDADGTIKATYELPVATESILGGVMPDGNTLRVNGNGVMSAQVATVGSVGVLKPDGTTISISADGTITATGGGEGGSYILPTATGTQLGGVKIDNETLVIDENGVLSVAWGLADEIEF